MLALAIASAAQAAESATAGLLPDYRRLDLVLAGQSTGEFPGKFEVLRLPLRLHLGYEPGKPLRQFWFTRPKVTVPIESLDGLTDKKLMQAKGRNKRATEANRRHLGTIDVQRRHLDASALECGAERVKGVVAFATRCELFDPKSGGVSWARGTVELDLTLSGGRASGAFTRSFELILPRDGGTRKIVGKGKVAGTVSTAAELARRHGIAPSKNVPAYTSDLVSKGFPSYGGPIVERACDARLVWLSEDNGASAWRGKFDHIFGGGYAPPILAEGRLYQYYFQPKPGGTQKSRMKKVRPAGFDPDTAKGEAYCLMQNVQEAQEVVVCMDAATGATLWRRVMDFDGAINYGLSGSKEGPYQPPCIADGKIFVQGTAGQLYCLDALTGETVWEDRTVRHTHEKKGINFTLQCVDGVLLVSGKSGSAGVDPKTGEQLWETSGSGGGRNVSYATWTHKDKTYILDRRGLHDPKTGKQLWSFPEEVVVVFPVVHGDIALVAHKNPNTRKASVSNLAHAYRISTDGCKKIWGHTPEDGGYCSFEAPALFDGRALYHIGTAINYKKVIVEVETGKTTIDESLRCESGILSSPAYADGLIIQGNSSVILRARKEPPYFECMGDLGYRGEWCIMGLYSDGRWFKRTDHGQLVCIDLRKETPR